jgi:hypothetical protein
MMPGGRTGLKLVFLRAIFYLFSTSNLNFYHNSNE